MDKDALYTAEQYGTAVGLSANAIRWHCRKGNLEAYDFNGTWMIPGWSTIRKNKRGRKLGGKNRKKE